MSYSQVFAPVSGRVNVLAARQGEVVATGAPIVTIMDLTQTWVYAPCRRRRPTPSSWATRCASSCLSGATI